MSTFLYYKAMQSSHMQNKKNKTKTLLRLQHMLIQKMYVSFSINAAFTSEAFVVCPFNNPTTLFFFDLEKTMSMMLKHYLKRELLEILINY